MQVLNSPWLYYQTPACERDEPTPPPVSSSPPPCYTCRWSVFDQKWKSRQITYCYQVTYNTYLIAYISKHLTSKKSGHNSLRYQSYREYQGFPFESLILLTSLTTTEIIQQELRHSHNSQHQISSCVKRFRVKLYGCVCRVESGEWWAFTFDTESKALMASCSSFVPCFVLFRMFCNDKRRLENFCKVSSSSFLNKSYLRVTGLGQCAHTVCLWCDMKKSSVLRRKVYSEQKTFHADKHRGASFVSLLNH